HLVEEHRIDELQARLEQLGAYHECEQAADQEHQQREHQVHRADVLVVRRGQPAHDALGGAVVGVLVVEGRVCHRVHSAAATVLAAAACCSSSQASNSACGFATTTIGMKAWSAPQSSVHWPRY